MLFMYSPAGMEGMFAVEAMAAIAPKYRFSIVAG
jgi:hypothetical protein